MKINSRYLLVLATMIVVVTSLLYTNHLVDVLKQEERQKVEHWARATSLIVDVETEDRSFDLVWSLIENNENIPVLITSETGDVLALRNFDERRFSSLMTDAVLQQKLIEKLSDKHQPLKIDAGEAGIQYIYYDDSILLKKLSAFPYVLWAVISVVLLFAVLAFTAESRAEQNRVWAGLSKETAHQLGTPISSLMALKEILKEQYADDEVVVEVEKDVERLNTIAERFSKIGSKPILEKVVVAPVLERAVEYMRRRTSSRVTYNVECPREALALINVPLFEWVIENLCKNAVDAMEGTGMLKILVEPQKNNHLYIDISDNGKGIDRKNFRDVFKPGYTTKKRGWGLGLSLAKRIIEEYHGGKIFVKSSEIGKGTTFRIVLTSAS
ncbi:MAG: HAMP domain-containing histidine kinase [Paludibacteraceae bacterium]|nr:HAMP domain-containing histidine kinase [Paludibacteraceae bacterium]